MTYNWSLKEIYTSFTSKEFLGDLENLDNKINELNTFSREVKEGKGDVNELEVFIGKFEEINLLLNRISSLANLTISADSKDKTARKYLDIINSKFSLLAEPLTKLYKWIASIKNIDTLIESSSILKEHNFIIKEIIEKNKYMLSDKEESIIARMRNTGYRCMA